MNATKLYAPVGLVLIIIGAVTRQVWLMLWAVAGLLIVQAVFVSTKTRGKVLLLITALLLLGLSMRG